MILSLVMALTAMGAFAQFEAGKTYVATSMSGLGLSYSKNDKVNLNLRATAGQLLADNLMMLGFVSYEYGGVDKKHQFELGVGGRYYIIQNGLYLGLSASYAFNRLYNAEQDRMKNYHYCYITPELGYAFFLGEHVTIEPAIYYSMAVNDFANYSKVGLRIGVGYYF